MYICVAVSLHPYPLWTLATRYETSKPYAMINLSCASVCCSTVCVKVCPHRTRYSCGSERNDCTLLYDSLNILLTSWCISSPYVKHFYLPLCFKLALPLSAVPWPGCTAEVERPVLSHHPSQCSSHCPAWDHRCGAQVQDALLCKSNQSLVIKTRTKVMHYLCFKWCTTLTNLTLCMWPVLAHSCSWPSVCQCPRSQWTLSYPLCTTWPQTSLSRLTSPDSTAPLGRQHSWSLISLRGSMSCTLQDRVRDCTPNHSTPNNLLYTKNVINFCFGI